MAKKQLPNLHIMDTNRPQVVIPNHNDTETFNMWISRWNGLQPN